MNSIDNKSQSAVRKEELAPKHLYIQEPVREYAEIEIE
jgi:hypothetical protein